MLVLAPFRSNSIGSLCVTAHFQNTYIGLSEIDPSIEEAADAFGMSRLRKLFKVELPIAMPVIISGVRTALVLIIERPRWQH